MEAEDFESRVDVAVARLLRAYRGLLTLAETRDSAEPHLQVRTMAAAAEIAHNCQTLLDRIHELRVRCILEGEDTSKGECS